MIRGGAKVSWSSSGTEDHAHPFKQLQNRKERVPSSLLDEYLNITQVCTLSDLRKPQIQLMG